MARPKKIRNCNCKARAYYFKPRGVPMFELSEIILEPDEFTALRYADMDKFYHEEAAEKMKISRATFGRIIESARFKIADGIINGKAIRIPKPQ